MIVAGAAATAVGSLTVSLRDRCLHFSLLDTSGCRGGRGGGSVSKGATQNNPFQTFLHTVGVGTRWSVEVSSVVGPAFTSMVQVGWLVGWWVVGRPSPKSGTGK